MRKVVLVALAVVAFYAHAKITFSESSVSRWISQHSLKSISGDETVCDDFRDDVVIAVTSTNPQDPGEIEGGKDEICEFYAIAAKGIKLMQARVSTNFEDIQVVQSGFPWLEATVTYSTQSSISGQHLPTVKSTSEDKLVLRRTLSGIKIQRLESVGSVEAL